MSIVRDITEKTARETFELVEDYYSGTMNKPLKQVFENYLIEIENKLDLKYEITDDTSTLKGGVGEDPLHGFGSFGWGNLLESPDANVANSYIWTARNTITNESYLQMGVYRKDGTSESILDFDVNGGNIPFTRLGLKEAGSFTQAIQFTTSGTYLAGTAGGATDAGNNIEDATSDSKVLIVNGDYVKSTNMSQFKTQVSTIAEVTSQLDYEEAYDAGFRAFNLSNTSYTEIDVNRIGSQYFMKSTTFNHELTVSVNNAYIILEANGFMSLNVTGNNVIVSGTAGNLVVDNNSSTTGFRLQEFSVQYLNLQQVNAAVSNCNISYFYQDTTATNCVIGNTNIGIYNLRGPSRNDATTYNRVNVGVVENMNTLHWGTSLIGTGWSTVTSTFNLSVANGSMVEVRDTTTLTP
jgi:hypothetical protein